MTQSSNNDALLARITLNQRVLGSSPSAPTIETSDLIRESESSLKSRGDEIERGDQMVSNRAGAVGKYRVR